MTRIQAFDETLFPNIMMVVSHIDDDDDDEIRDEQEESLQESYSSFAIPTFPFCIDMPASSIRSHQPMSSITTITGKSTRSERRSDRPSSSTRTRANNDDAEVVSSTSTIKPPRKSCLRRESEVRNGPVLDCWTATITEDEASRNRNRRKYVRFCNEGGSR
jgi:hypothetical protein